MAAETPSAETGPPKIPRPLEAVLAETNARLEDAFFGYDRSDLSGDALAILRQDAGMLAPVLDGFPTVQVIVEGHCDDRGSAEYNLALGDRRASRAAEVLRQFGVAPAGIAVVSYGKEKPQCMEADESCRQKNRRAHLILQISR